MDYSRGGLDLIDRTYHCEPSSLSFGARSRSASYLLSIHGREAGTPSRVDKVRERRCRFRAHETDRIGREEGNRERTSSVENVQRKQWSDCES
jgi:hypothetical protein